jgi:hypothetical protein
VKVPPVASTQRATTSPRPSTRAKHRATNRAATRSSPPPPSIDKDKDAAATQRLIERDLAGFLPPSRSTDRPSQ